MEETIRNKISEKLRERYKEKVGYPLPVIQERFGEDFVDIVLIDDTLDAWIQTRYKDGMDIDFFVDKGYDYLCGILNPRVVIRFPEVEIRNEKEEHRTLRELYVALNISNGRLIGTFLINRTTYTQAEFFSGYMHSHVHPFSFTQWNVPCLGRGPISNTISSLASSGDANLWMLFLEELKTFLETESIKGVPYIQMSSVVFGKLNKIDDTKIFPAPMQKVSKKCLGMLQPLLAKYIADMKVSLTTDSVLLTFYLPSDSVITFWEKLSCMVTEKFGSDDTDIKGMQKKYVFNDKGWFEIKEDNPRTQGLEGKDLFLFKGEMKKLTVIKDCCKSDGEAMLDIQIARAIYSLIMLKINLIGYETRRKTEGHFVF